MIPRVISILRLHFLFGVASIWYQNKGAIMATRSKRNFRGRALLDCTWIIDREFQELNQDLYERFHAFNSLGLSFPKPGGVDGGIGSKAQTLIWHSLDDKGLS